MKILVLNCGSSSIKYQLIDMVNNSNLLAKGLLDRVGFDNSELCHQHRGNEKYIITQPIPDHQTGINLILETLVHPVHGVISDVNEIKAAGHRVAHGGEFFSKSTLIDEQAKKDIEKLCELAPLHNPANLKGILSLEKILPEIPQVAVFDTSFHQTMPAHAYLYGIPYSYYQKYKIRRYGFHGTSHKFVAQKACDLLGEKMDDINIITCHLGNGASIAAIQKGKSVDTSMGFTPIEGLIMGTRCGDIDLGIAMFIEEKENLHPRACNDIFNKKSGMLGVTGISSDMRDIEKAALGGSEIAETALEMYAYRVKKYIGAYAAAMGGTNIIVFTGGIGENADDMRERCCSTLGFMGAKIDPTKNNGLRGKDAIISTDDSTVKVMVITTNEELVIARDTYHLVKD
ncbi:MAG: acetate kinase [Bacteroidota bacterium]